MRLRDIGRSLRDEKKVLRNGIILLSFGAFLVLLILNAGRVWSALSTVLSTASPAIYGIVLAYILNVFVHFFEDFAFRPFQKCKSPLWKKLRRPLSILLAYMVVLGVVLFITCFIIPGLIQSMSTIAETARETVPVYANAAIKWINGFAAKYDLTFIQDFLKGFNWTSLFSNVTRVTTDFLASLMNVTFNVASGIFTAVMSFIFSIYMLFGKEKLLKSIKATLLAFLPYSAAKHISRVGALSNRVFFSFIRGQLTECVILGGLCYIGMSLLGLDYALLISSVVALGALIPILGAYIGAAVGVIILLLVHPINALIFLIFLLCLQQIEGNLIYPRVVGSSIGLPPVWTLFAILFWGGILGIPGILVGTPLTAVIYQLLRNAVTARLKEKSIDPKDPHLPKPAPEEEPSQTSPSQQGLPGEGGPPEKT